VATVLLRGSTDSILDDLERAVDDGVNTYKVCGPCWLKLISLRCTYCISLLGMLNCFLISERFSDYWCLYQSMCRDSRIIPGAAATEIELAQRLKEFSLKETG
jgi:T-complex protein 1 subunit theta